MICFTAILLLILCQVVRGIGGGEKAKEGEWPWIVSVFYKSNTDKSYSFICGGSLIGQKWIISAAHCFLDRAPDATNEDKNKYVYKVHLGTLQTDAIDTNVVMRKLKRIIPHEKYSLNSVHFDIAVAELEEPVEMHDLIKNAALEAPNNVDVKDCMIAGWGKTAHNGPLSTHLLTLKVPIVEHLDCVNMYKDIMLSNDVICAGYVTDCRGTYYGDSGGPLMCKVSNAWVQVGVLSYSDSCPSYNDYKPSVFIRVKNYIGWINTNTV
ncbi:plasma kallikrein [Amia ocellicauda]|uniref:plasma kallikrein n=1 Tax=Amia ocellicauda TaxID=2972642 RepID=UPI003464E7AD